MRIRILRVLVVSLIAAGILAAPGVASAKVEQYEVQFSPVSTGGNSLMIVNLVLTEDTKLPARVRVPLPAEATLLWAGEILGGPVESDPSRDASVTPGAKSVLVEFTLTEAHVAQVEAEWSPATVSGDRVSSALSWVNSADPGPVAVSVRLPAGIRSVKIAPDPFGEPAFNEAGESLYVLPVVDTASGDVVEVKVEYRLGAETELPWLLIGLGAVLVLAVAGLVYAAYHDKRRRAAEAVAVEPYDFD